MHQGCGVAAATHLLITLSSCCPGLELYQPWLSLAPAPDVPFPCRVHPGLTHRGCAVPPLRSSAYVRSFARCCLSWRIRGFAVRSRNEAGLGWPGAAPLLSLQPLLCPSGAVSPRPGHAPRVPHTICFVRCPCSPSARHGESGGVGHSTNNPCEAAKLGQRCFLSRELDGGAMGGDAGAPGAVGEGGCSRSVTAVQPGRSASSADPSASSLSLDLSWTQFQQREPAWLAEGRAQGGAGSLQAAASPEQRWSEWERSPCWRNQ